MSQPFFFVWLCYGILGLIGLDGNNWRYWEFHLVVKLGGNGGLYEDMCLEKQVFSWTSVGANFAATDRVLDI